MLKVKYVIVAAALTMSVFLSGCGAAMQLKEE
jgi:hypothetical protein